MITDIFIWWLVVQVIGLLGLPLTTFFFRTLPDQGYAFSKSMGLLLIGYGGWLLAMFGLGSFGAPLLLIVGLLVGGAGMLLQRTRVSEYAPAGPEPITTKARLARLLLGPQAGRLSGRTLLTYEVVFVVALLFMAWLRSYNPHPWGTERPMDYAFFNAIRNSALFPPHDPWLAGYSINYYYFGYLLMAVVGLLSGRDPAVAYNLALALIFALTALGTTGIIFNLIAMTRREQQPETDDTNEPRSRRSWSFGPRLLVALLGVVLVLLVGNQAGALQVITGNHRVVALDGPQLASALAQAVRGAETIELPYPANTSDFGEITRLERENGLDNFNWWWPSRTLWDDYSAEGRPRQYTITEFPFFSFWLGDMHPHVMALPFGLLAMALTLTTLTRPALPTFAQGRQGWADLIMTGLILGSLYTINSWDLPTYVLLYAGAILLLYLHLNAGTISWRHLGKQFGLVLLALFLLFSPFYLTFHSLVGSAAPLLDIPLLGKITRIIGPVWADRSGLHEFLIIFGLFVLPLSAFVYLTRSRNQTASQRSVNALGIVAGHTEGEASPSFTRSALNLAFNPWLTPLLLLIGLLIGFPLLALLGLGLLAARQAVRRATVPAEAFVLLIITLGCAISFGTELIYIRDVFEGMSVRFNTIFKFYYQVWLLWGSVTAYALWWLLTQTTHTRRIVAYSIGALFTVFLAGGLIYPAINLRDMVTKGTQVGLMGETPREHSVAGREAIRWLREHVTPGNVVLEAVHPHGGSYNGEGFGGVSAGTGLPTVIGWVGHEEQWRGGDEAARAELEPRKTDVELIYSTPDPAQARALLDKYDVRYVYVGELERQNYTQESLAKFDQIGQPVFQMDEVTIYAIPEEQSQ
jgi:YYY domain-containing protein